MVRVRRWFSSALCVGFAALFCGCENTARLPSDVYVWNRSWSAAVQQSVSDLPPGVSAVRVLLDEVGPTPAEITVDLKALVRARAPVIAVLRAGKAMPTEADLQRLNARVIALRTRGLSVDQVELDFDAPTEGLGAWVERLQQLKVPGRRLSVTALPTWASSPHAAALANAVDEVVLQVHTVRAPTLFDAEQALADARQWAEATHRPFRVALPAYRATLADGQQVAAEPAAVAAAMRALERLPEVSGFVFFRLGNREDRGAWSPATLEAVLRREPVPAPRVEVQLEAFDPAGHDVWVVNTGRLDALAPRHFGVSGAIAHSEATTGYQGHADADAARFTTPHPLWLRPGERIRVGTVRGENLNVSQ